MPQNWVRFAVQYKKEFLRDMRSLYDGLVIPANILLYQYKATPTLIYMCQDRPFTVDPMTYLLALPLNAFTLESGDIKPSFERLVTEGHGLNVGEVGPGIASSWLAVKNQSKIAGLVTHVLNMQRYTVLKSFKRYSRDFVQWTEGLERLLTPRFLMAPYLLSDSDAHIQVTSEIWSALPEALDGVNVFPVLYLTRDQLTRAGGLSQVQVLAGRFRGVVIWVENFDETSATMSEILGLARLISVVATGRLEGPRTVFALYGGYFWLTLTHIGLTAISHGTSFGESKAGLLSTRPGGPAPVRYYIRQLHRFYPLDSAVRMTTAFPELLCECPACQRVVKRQPARIAEYAREPWLAEIHFLYNRFLEKDYVAQHSLQEIIDELEAYQTLYEEVNKVLRPHRGVTGDDFRPVASTEHLTVWRTALSQIVTGEHTA